MVQAKQNGDAAYMVVNHDWCKGCGICEAFCPKSAISLNGYNKAIIDGERCITCRTCESFCPDFAIARVKRRLPVNAGNETGLNARQ